MIVVGDRDRGLARVRPARAQARAEQPDVDVSDGVEVPERLPRTRLGGERWLRRGRDAGVVDAERIDQPADEIGHRQGQDGLLVAHRGRVVDHEEEIDLVDPALREPLLNHGGDLRLVGLEGRLRHPIIPVKSASEPARAGRTKARRKRESAMKDGPFPVCLGLTRAVFRVDGGQSQRGCAPARACRREPVAWYRALVSCSRTPTSGDVLGSPFGIIPRRLEFRALNKTGPSRPRRR